MQPGDRALRPCAATVHRGGRVRVGRTYTEAGDWSEDLVAGPDRDAEPRRRVRRGHVAPDRVSPYVDATVDATVDAAGERPAPPGGGSAGAMTRRHDAAP